MLTLPIRIVHHKRLRQLLEPELTTHARTLKHAPHLPFREPVMRHPVGAHALVDLARHEVHDEQHAAGTQTLGQTPRREGRVVEVVEARAHARQVKVGELRV